MRIAFPQLSTLALGLVLTLFVSPGARADDIDCSWNTIDCGGATFSTGGTFDLGGTAGQHDASVEMTGGTLSLTGGFWPGIADGFTCLADVAGHDGLVNIDDLLFVINHWGEAGGPADIAPGGGDGTVNIDDLLAVINGWGACP